MQTSSEVLFKLTRIIRYPIGFILWLFVIIQFFIMLFGGAFLFLVSDDVINIIDEWFDIQAKAIDWCWS